MPVYTPLAIFHTRPVYTPTDVPTNIHTDLKASNTATPSYIRHKPDRAAKPALYNFSTLFQYSIESSNSALNCSLSSPISSLNVGANINTRFCGKVPSTKSSICPLPNPKSFSPLG